MKERTTIIDGNIIIDNNTHIPLLIKEEVLSNMLKDNKIYMYFVDKRADIHIVFTQPPNKQTHIETILSYNLIISTVVERLSKYLEFLKEEWGIVPLIHIPEVLLSKAIPQITKFLQEREHIKCFTQKKVSNVDVNKKDIFMDTEKYVSILYTLQPYYGGYELQHIQELRKEIANELTIDIWDAARIKEKRK